MKLASGRAIMMPSINRSQHEQRAWHSISSHDFQSVNTIPILLVQTIRGGGDEALLSKSRGQTGSMPYRRDAEAVIDPDILLLRPQLNARVSELSRTIAANRPLAGESRVRVPGDGSLK